ncbi:MAG: MotA/TolQ/ExbB proton channel family protein [Rhodospirillales bacterium]|nr:MotA/TolQ/ExbB proton channel family protein [Rhodospirillales bacterium]
MTTVQPTPAGRDGRRTPAKPRPASSPIGAPGRRRRLGNLTILAAAVVIAIVAMKVMEWTLPPALAVVLLDYREATYPLTVQTVMWIVFALGIGELIVRARETTAERAELNRHYLPEDETTVLQSLELRRIYAAARAAMRPDSPSYGRFLPHLIQRVVTQFQTNRSVDQANALLNSSLDLGLHEIDLRYMMIRYVIWAIPALGFLGTVLGIALALAYAGAADLQDPALLAGLTERLAVAFNTTLLALCMSAVLVLVQHVVQAREERALNRAGQYCLDNLINRLYAD